MGNGYSELHDERGRWPWSGGAQGWSVGRCMRRLAPLAALALAAAGAAHPTAAASNCTTSDATVTCTYTGTGEQTFAVPGGVTSLQVTAIGGAGGSNGFGFAGKGARVATTLAVNPDAILYVEVGGNGSGGGAGGVGGGGGGGGPTSSPGAGGGGATDVQTVHCATAGSCVVGTPHADLLIVAGGGGGSGGGSDGGNAGNADGSGNGGGEDSVYPECAYPGLPCAGQGGGATTTAGGSGGGGEPADSGAFGASQNGASGTLGQGGNGGSGESSGAGGGGGGLYGGGGGGGAHYVSGAGGGGSSYSAGTNTSTSTDPSGTPQVVIGYTLPTLTITANNQSMTYGGVLPALTAGYSGFVDGDTPASLTTAPACTTSAGSTSPVGSYAITCNGAVDPTYSISYQPGTLTVNPAPLTITANDRTMTYGGAVPTFDASFGGLVNGDTAGVVSGLACGATDGQDHPISGNTPAGTYTIICSGGSASNYSISYATGTLTIARAPLTIAAGNQSMTYGGVLPALTAGYSGFVDGEGPAALSTAPACTTTATGSSPVGSYAITCAGASAANYTISYQPGTLTVNPAPLTITANNQTTSYGHLPVDTWTSTGWVNGDAAGVLAVAPNSAPTCRATVNGAAESATTPPGVYTGAISCQGAGDPNYTITYVSGTLTVDPLLSLDEQGLPASVPHQATLDGQTVTLPDANVEVAYGSSHSYSFPATVTDSSGTVYITTDGGFSGAVTANRTDTAVYQNVAQAISAALAAGGINSSGVASALTQQFAAVQADIKAGNTPQALADLHSFAAHVRAQSGTHLTTATAQALLTDAQLVYASLGGTGMV